MELIQAHNSHPKWIRFLLYIEVTFYNNSINTVIKFIFEEEWAILYFEYLSRDLLLVLGKNSNCIMEKQATLRLCVQN